MAIKKIGIVATARAIKLEELQATLTILHDWGFETKVGKSIGQVDFHFAGTDANRAADLAAMLLNPQIDAILFARGGYGTARILDLIDWKKMPQKPMLGFSDLTALHCHVHNLGWQSIHSVMCSTIPSSSEATLSSLKQFLCGEQLSYEFESHSFNKKGSAKAKIIGGNLSVLHSLMGSVSEVDFDGKILLLEDLDEYLYRIDRMMLCLYRAGKLNNLAGLLIGGFTDLLDNDTPFGHSAYEIINRYISDFDYPIAFNVPVGHQADNFTLPFGVEMKFEVKEEQCFLLY